MGSIGGAAAKLAIDSIKSIKVLEFPELGMEAIWKIEVENFPAFIIIDDKGNDFYNIRYQIKPFMIWIWISVILLSLGGFLSLIKKND